MLPEIESMYKCPHCGGEKALMNLRSGNTFGAQMWSDAKQVAPMLPRLSPIQRCPHCGGYYFLHEAEERRGVDYSDECGWLTFDEAMEAAASLRCKTEDDKGCVLLIGVWAYNDIVRGGNTSSEEQQKRFVRFVEENQEALHSSYFDKLVVAEILREVGKFDECISLIEQSTFEQEGYQEVAEKILEQAKARNTAVFIIWQEP